MTSSSLSLANLIVPKPQISREATDDLRQKSEPRKAESKSESKLNDEIEIEDSSHETTSTDFQNWMNVFLLPPAPVTQTPLEANLTVTTMATQPLANTMSLPLNNLPTETIDQARLGTPLMSDSSESITTNISGMAETSAADSADILKKFADILNTTQTTADTAVQITSNNSNKLTPNTDATTTLNLVNNNEALLSIISSVTVNTPPASTPAKGMDIRLNKIGEIDLYAANSNADLVDVAEPLVDSATTKPRADTLSQPVSKEAVFTQGEIVSQTITTQHSSLQTISSNGTPNVGFTSTSALTNPILQNATPTQPHAATQAVAALISKNIKDGSTGSQSISVRLDPAELGRMDIRMEYKKGEPLKVHLVVEKGDTLNMFKREQHILENALNQAGIKSDNMSLSFELNHNAFQNAMNHNNSHNNSNFGQSANANNSSLNELNQDVIQTTPDIYTDPRTGRIHYNLMV
jgi:flagellar hook-length control protein FliK